MLDLDIEVVERHRKWCIVAHSMMTRRTSCIVHHESMTSVLCVHWRSCAKLQFVHPPHLMKSQSGFYCECGFSDAW